MSEVSVFANLSAVDQAKVDSKLTELSRKTGKVWTCEITQRGQNPGGQSLLELTINGRIILPMSIDANADNPGDHICSELDRLYRDPPPASQMGGNSEPW